jgi:cellulose synthase (UDP-forming)
MAEGITDGRGPVDGGQRNLEPLLSRSQRLFYCAAIGLWLIVFVSLWIWWLQPEHNLGTARLIFNSLIVAWLTLLPLYFLSIFIHARVPARAIAQPSGMRVAMVVTKAPSEPFSVVRQTLMGMLAQDVPHDTWLADEAPDKETIEWCENNGVRISTRQGVEEYHRATWPRRTRCKEGNLAYFYDHYGYDTYEVVVQMDADHVPAPGYLRAMLAPFSDPKVGYVSAPSICDRNVHDNWAARGRLFVEATFHGLLQAGYNAGWAPICIGSHYAVRTKALKEIGGLGPELAEDHSTTLMMNAHGWRGVHAFDATANGFAPQTFSDLVTQEFQWARSLVAILLNYSPLYIPRLSARLRFQFLFCQLWYPLLAVFMLSIYLTPIIALLMGDRFVNVQYLVFCAFFLALEVLLCVMALSWRANGWCRPRDARVLSWEAMLFPFVKWPWIFAGTIVALYDKLTGASVDFRVTPKGGMETPGLPWRALFPYLLLATGAILPLWFVTDPGRAAGFYIFATVNALIYASIVCAVLADYFRATNERSRPFRLMQTAPAAACVVLLLALPVVAFSKRAPVSVEAILWGQNWLTVTEAISSASGAGMDGPNTRKVRFRWPITGGSG